MPFVAATRSVGRAGLFTLSVLSASKIEMPVCSLGLSRFMPVPESLAREIVPRSAESASGITALFPTRNCGSNMIRKARRRRLPAPSRG